MRERKRRQKMNSLAAQKMTVRHGFSALDFALKSEKERLARLPPAAKIVPYTYTPSAFINSFEIHTSSSTELP
jgi:hypothetical protein